MQIGAMNHPARDVMLEIQWMANARLDFVDLTLEPPSAASWQIDPASIRATLDQVNLGVVGHTAYYLPIGHPFEEVREAAVRALVESMHTFAAIGAPWMNVHPDGHAPFHGRAFTIEQNVKSLQSLLEAASSIGIGLMIENIPEGFNTPQQLAELLDPLPGLALHLDIGHANLRVPKNTTESILERFADRLRHVHLHDNRGDSDAHLPLGAGSIDVPRMVHTLRAFGYDATITLEVFTADRRYLEYSRDRLRELWNER